MIVRGQPFAKRLSMPLEFRRDITLYGKSNLYPQMVEQVMFRSATTSAAVRSLTDFTKGEGFTNNGEMIVNRKEQTLDEVLNIASHDYSVFDGFALHFNVNELFQITEITPMDFKSVRYGLPDEKGRHQDVKVNNNWEDDPNKTLMKTEKISTFPLWQERENVVDFDDVDKAGGFVLYWTPQPDQYPKATFDAVLDSAQTDAEVQMFELGNIQNGFLGASIFKHPGKIASKAERLDLERDLAQMQGSENANSIMIVETPPDFEQELIENLAANNNDRLFELTHTNVVARIMNNFSMPFPIAGLQPTGGGVFNTEQIEDSFLYYNAKTRNRRAVLGNAFGQFMEFWAGGSVDPGDIVPLDFIEAVEESIPGVEGEGEEEQRIEKSQRSPEELQAQANLRGSVGGVQGILGIQAAVGAGTTDYDSAISILVEVYGFSERVAIELLGERTEELSEEQDDGTGEITNNPE